MQRNPNVHRKQRLIELATGAGAAVVGAAIVRTAVTKIKSCSFCMAITCFATKLVLPDLSPQYLWCQHQPIHLNYPLLLLSK